MICAKCEIKRSNNSNMVAFFRRGKDVTTCLMKAMNIWQGGNNKRKYEILLDDPKHPIVGVSFEESDTKVGIDFLNSCEENGIEKVSVKYFYA